MKPISTNGTHFFAFQTPKIAFVEQTDMTGQAKVRRRLAYQPEFQHVAGAGDKDDVAEAAAVFVASQDGTIEIDLAQLVPSTSASTSTSRIHIDIRRICQNNYRLCLIIVRGKADHRSAVGMCTTIFFEARHQHPISGCSGFRAASRHTLHIHFLKIKLLG